jgi:hypothetical protein
MNTDNIDISATEERIGWSKISGDGVSESQKQASNAKRMASTCDVSDIVTLNYRNRRVWESPSGGIWAPRWIRIQILSRQADTGLASVAEDSWSSDRLLNVVFIRCACGTEFAVDTRGDIPLCKSCDQQRRAASQRNRRARQRAPKLTQVCVYCGGGLAAERRTRKYCCGTCRVAALRARSRA